MNLAGCMTVKRKLPAFHDCELTIEEQVAVESHLRGCPGCAAELRRLRAIGEAVRVGVTARTRQLSGDEVLAGLPERVTSRLNAERYESLAMRVDRMFVDLHLVWAALGATSAAVACVAALVGLLYSSTSLRQDSLAGVLAALASPGSNEHPMSMDGRMLLPRYYPDDLLPASVTDQEEDSVFALAAVVTREGRISTLELLDGNQNTGRRSVQANRQAVLELLDSIARARFEPARSGGSPVAVNMVWLLAHLTVRPQVAGERRLPPRAISVVPIQLARWRGRRAD